jgi:hypothetical protein
MAKDYIVEEVRRIREEQAARYGFNIESLLQAAMKRQASPGSRSFLLHRGKSA